MCVSEIDWFVTPYQFNEWQLTAYPFSKLLRNINSYFGKK